MTKGMPGIDSQIAAMRERWPRFEVVRRDARSALWRGELRPLMQTYQVEVFYRAPLVVERLDPLRQQPEVRVIAPRLRRRDDGVEGPLPHVYWDRADIPMLCLFDHEAGQWTPFDLLADTTLPWSLDWLACYEGWRATGEWTGGGRHAPLKPAPEALQ